jgi:capsular exopolysaccharide synthesis family protein
LVPVYKCEAKLKAKITPGEPQFVEDLPKGFGMFGYFDKDLVMGSMEELLKSGPVIRKVIEEMNLRDRKGNFFAPKKLINPDRMSLILFRKKGIRVDNIVDTETIQVTGYSSSPSEAKRIAENVIKHLLDLFSKMYQEEVERVIKILESRIPELNQQLRVSEKALADYQIENRAYNISTQISTLISELSTLGAELNRIDRVLTQHENNLLATKEALPKYPEFHDKEITLESNPLIVDSKKKLYAYEVSLAQKLTERTPEHPEVKMLKNEIAAMAAIISREIEKTFASQTISRNTYHDTLVENYSKAEIELVKDRATRKALLEQMALKEDMLKETPAKEKEVTALTRERDNLKKIYSSYCSNLEAAKSARLMKLSNVVVIQPPLLLDKMSENLYFPKENNGLYIVLAIGMGVVCGLFLVFLSDYLDDRIYDVQEIRDLLGKRVIGLAPRCRKRHLKANSIKTSPLAASVHHLLMNMRLYKGEEIGKSISIVSTSRGEGKSILASFMAMVLAEQGKRTLLIDGNLGNPGLHRIFNVSEEDGLRTYLTDDLNLQDLAHPTSIQNLEIIIGGDQTKARPRWYFDADKLKKALGLLTLKYDFVVLDTPALEWGGEAGILSQDTNDIVLVVEPGKNSKVRIQRSIDFFAMTKSKDLWTVINKVKDKS